MSAIRARALPLLFYLVGAGIAVLLLRFVHYAPFGHDEIEHVHVSWRLLQGDRPYADFHQNHMPVVWWIGALALRVLPHSADAVLALRWLTTATLFVAMAVGWRLLVRLKPDAHAVVYPLAIIAMLCVGFRLEWYAFRPDPFMSLFVTLALAVTLGRDLTHARALLAGVLLAVAACFSPKMWPLLVLLPLRIGYEAWRAGSVRPLTRLASYGAGGAAVALPFVGWLVSQDLWSPFFLDVIAFNGAFPKPPFRALRFLRRPLLDGALLGAGYMLWLAWAGRVAPRWPYAAIAASVWLGFSAIAFTVHSAVYNQQAATIPAGLALAVAGAAIVGRRGSAWRLVLLTLVVGVSIHREVRAMARPTAVDGWIVTQQDLDALVDLSTPGPMSCVAFAPCHPIYCPDASDLSLLWDYVFLRNPAPAFRMRQERYWTDAVEHISRVRPALVVERCDGLDPWEGAVTLGALAPEALGQLRGELNRHYDARDVGRSRVWIAR